MDICCCSEGYICAANTHALRAPCTCAPHVSCAACVAWEHAHRLPKRPRAARPLGIDRPAVALLLKAYRLSRGLTQQHASRLLGLHKSTLAELERGNTQYPPPHTLHVLREVVGIPEHFLARRSTV